MYNLITILGPTATGKTKIAAQVAYQLQSAVISADSRQVYKNMNIGTGKDIEDYQVGDKMVPYYLIDIKEAGEKYNVFEYQRDFYNIFGKLINEGKTPVLCGGTGLYIEAVLKEYDLLEVPVNEKLRKSLEGKTLAELAQILSKYKSLHNKTDIDTVKRAIRAIEIADYEKNNKREKKAHPAINSLVIGIYYPRDELKKRITERLKSRLKNGLIDEVKDLLNMGLSPNDLIYYGLEYKFITMYLLQQLSYDEMFLQLNIAIHQFSKRQMTWFRRMERNGTIIHWLDGSLPLDYKVEHIIRLLKT